VRDEGVAQGLVQVSYKERPTKPGLKTTWQSGENATQKADENAPAKKGKLEGQVKEVYSGRAGPTPVRHKKSKKKNGFTLESQPRVLWAVKNSRKEKHPGKRTFNRP